MGGAVEQLARVYASFPFLFWAVGSLALYLLGIHTFWLLRSLRVWHTLAGRALILAARLAFYLGIPYLALGGWPLGPFQGLLSLADMGLVGFGGRWTVGRWLETAGTALGLGLLGLLILGLAWVNANRRGSKVRLYFAPRPWWSLLVDSLLLEVHWAFYRAVLVAVLGDVYSGIFGALGLVFLEWALNPFWRRGWRQADEAAAQWLRASLALISTLIFVLTRNLWVCLVVHLALTWIFWHLGRLRDEVYLPES